MLVAIAVLVVGCAGINARVSAAAGQWGGTPRTALVATKDLPVGAVANGFEEASLPPAAVPATAVQAVPAGARLALALPAGAVLTSAHLDARGPAAGLDGGLRAVPIAAEQGWGVVAGGWVDVWVLGDGGAGSSRLVAESRPVVEVRTDETGITALIGLAEDEVAAATSALGIGGVLLAHAPAPADDN